MGYSKLQIKKLYEFYSEWVEPLKEFTPIEQLEDWEEFFEKYPRENV